MMTLTAAVGIANVYPRKILININNTVPYIDFMTLVHLPKANREALVYST